MGAWAHAATRELKYHPSSKVFWTTVGFPVGSFLALKSRLITLSSKIQVTGEGAGYAGPAVYVNWHKHLPFLISHHGSQGRWMMVSGAPYMEPIAAWCRQVGLQLARGASGAGGRQALQELVSALRTGGSAAIAVDGPAGPGFKVKPGCIDLAIATGAPVIPVSYTCKRALADAKRWDQMLVPRTFDEITIRYGRPIHFAPGTVIAEAQGLVEAALNQLDPGGRPAL